MKNLFLLLPFLMALGCQEAPKAEAETTSPPVETEMEKPTKTYVDQAFDEADPDVTGEEVTYNTATTELKGYIAYDKKVTGKRPGVLVVHEWWGHNDYARKRAEMLAELGYVALAVDMYGDGKKAGHPEDAGKFAGAVFANIDEAKARFEAALETLKANEMVDNDQIAAIGYCFGGGVVLSMANAGYDLDAVAAFHSGVDLPIMPAADQKLDTKILVANGADDPFIPLESVVAWTKAMGTNGASYEYISLDDTKHGFTDPGATARGKEFELPLEYNEAADRKSWLSLQKLLDEVF